MTKPWFEDEIGLGPSHSDLDLDRARTDSGWRAATAEWLVSCEAYNRAAFHDLRARQYALLVSTAHLQTIMISRGYAEYATDLADNITELDEMRARDALKTALAGHALAELTDDYQRAEFACLAYRYESERWPNRIDAQGFMESRFGWRSAGDILLRAVNEYDQRKCGLFFAPREWMEEAMQFPVDETNSNDQWPWCFVSAEAQLCHRLHRIYRRWAYKSITEYTP